MTRDPDLKQRSLLQAALVEFAANGYAGTPVDAVARRAGCSTGLVYTYFGSKAALFEAVLSYIAEVTVEQVPITPADLPGYAARLYDAGLEHPEVMRFVGWYQLERRGAEVDGATVGPPAALKAKVRALRRAQREGVLPADLDPANLILGVQAISLMWVNQAPAANDREAKRRRQVIVSLTQRLILNDHLSDGGRGSEETR